MWQARGGDEGGGWGGVWIEIWQQIVIAHKVHFSKFIHIILNYK